MRRAYHVVVVHREKRRAGTSRTPAISPTANPPPRHTMPVATPPHGTPPRDIASLRYGPPQRDSPATPRQTPAGNSPPYGHSTAMQTKSRMNSAETTQITGWTSFALPLQVFTMQYVMKPPAMPYEIE